MVDMRHGPKFAEGDSVRNVLLDMGIGVITRHSAGPRSVRWGSSWWVSFPYYHDPKWADPDARGTAGWYREDALELLMSPAHDRIAVWDAKQDTFIEVPRQEAIDGIMRYAATMRPGEPARAVVEAQALALARCGAADWLAVANFYRPDAAK